MTKVEVEHRGLLTEEKFMELNKYLKKDRFYDIKKRAEISSSFRLY